VLAESASWLCETARQLAERARGELMERPDGKAS
jgi:hypothetical protein